MQHDPCEPLEVLSDDELHVAVRRMTARSNVALADLLAHLGEVEARGIHRNRACATLYTYCVYELRMSEDSAFRRAKAARLVHQFPELRCVIARGEIHLTGLLMIAPHLGGERHAEVLERARFHSKREISRLIAELDPKPEAPPRIEPIAPARHRARTVAEALAGPVRQLPEGERPEDWIEPGEESIESMGQKGDKEQELADAERALEGAFEMRRRAPAERALQFKVQFTASQEYLDLLEEAIDLLGFKKKAASLPEVQLHALRELVDRLRKQKRGAKPAAPETSAAPAQQTELSASMEPAQEAGTSEGAAPARQTELPPSTSNGRYVPADVRSGVWARDAARCAYVDERGRRCSETRGLQVHHRQAHGLGGPATVDNLELRCAPHNLLAAEEDFGRAYMDCVRGIGGRRRSIDVAAGHYAYALTPHCLR